jgi:MYXO-CTERM domain-containing protein
MSVRSFILVGLFSLIPAVAGAHAVVTSPPPRVDAANIKEATAPCGGPRGDVVTQLTGGQMLTMEWDETIAHPGFHQLRFSMAGDTNWQMIADNIPDQGGVGSYSYEFQVPDVTCDQCTFQWIQVMTDRNPPVNYYSCFDVEITGSSTNVPDAGTPDMGGGVPDTGMDSGEPQQPANNGVGGNNQTGGENNANPTPVDPFQPQVDAGVEGDVATTHINGTGTCSSVSGSTAGELALILLGVFAFGRRRRRQSAGTKIFSR